MENKSDVNMHIGRIVQLLEEASRAQCASDSAVSILCPVVYK